MRYEVEELIKILDARHEDDGTNPDKYTIFFVIGG
jgi:hypothetical protein